MQNFTRQKKLKKLINLSSDCENTFYKDWIDGINRSLVTDFQKNNVSDAPKEDVKNFLFATSDFGEEILGETDLYITLDRLNDASFRRKLDPILKNIIRNQLSYFLKILRLSMRKIL